MQDQIRAGMFFFLFGLAGTKQQKADIHIGKPVVASACETLGYYQSAPVVYWADDFMLHLEWHVGRKSKVIKSPKASQPSARSQL